MKKVLTSFLLIIVLIFSFTIYVNAASSDVYNVVTCPGEDMATTMRINFQSNKSIKDLSVEYTVATDTTYANAKTVEATYVEFSRSDRYNGNSYVGMSEVRNVWNAELVNLSPKTKYIYRIVSGDKAYATDYTFETASSTNEDFSFLFMTDPQYYNEDGASKFNIMTEQHIKDSDIKFALITGDITDKGGNSSYWDMFYTKSSLKKIPFITTVGNHEYYDSGTATIDNSIYNHYFNNPQNGPEHCKGSSYYFLYNNVLFIMLDSEVKGINSELVSWFKSVCNSYTVDYIIVGCHRSCYAGAQYYSDGVTFLKTWGSVFDECAVDLVLSGHDHMFARTKNLYKDAVSTNPYLGTTYILGGSAGNKYYSKQNNTNIPKWDCYFDRTTVSTVISVTSEGLKTKTIDIDGNVKDQSTLTKKRFGTKDPNFTKEAFEKTFVFQKDASDMTCGTISWDKMGYGNVISMNFELVNDKTPISQMMFLNETCTSLTIDKKLWKGELNTIKVTINYVDKTSSDVILTVDNSYDWGTIGKIKEPIVTHNTIKFSWNQNLKDDYIQMYRVYRNDTVIQNVFIKDSNRVSNEFTVELNSRYGIKPDTTYTFKVVALSLNGTEVWSDSFTVTTLVEDEPDVVYEKEMAKIAYGFFIENILNALK